MTYFQVSQPYVNGQYQHPPNLADPCGRCFTPEPWVPQNFCLPACAGPCAPCAPCAGPCAPCSAPCAPPCGYKCKCKKNKKCKNKCCNKNIRICNPCGDSCINIQTCLTPCPIPCIQPVCQLPPIVDRCQQPFLGRYPYAMNSWYNNLNCSSCGFNGLGGGSDGLAGIGNPNPVFGPGTSGGVNGFVSG